MNNKVKKLFFLFYIMFIWILYNNDFRYENIDEI